MDLSNSEAEWIEKRIAELVEEYGSVPPPWFIFPDTHPYDIGWRMGAGESHGMVFSQWWERAKKDVDEAQRIEYFRRWPPPPRWLPWMMDVVCEKAQGNKCERCWNYRSSVGTFPDHSTLCDRCLEAIR